jgi:hypothetical protein
VPESILVRTVKVSGSEHRLTSLVLASSADAIVGATRNRPTTYDEPALGDRMWLCSQHRQFAQYGSKTGAAPTRVGCILLTLSNPQALE